MVFIKVVIDQDACLGCGTCTCLCVRFFELANSLEVAKIRDEFQSGDPSLGEVSQDIDCIRIAMNKCPVNAIKIINE